MTRAVLKSVLSGFCFLAFMVTAQAGDVLMERADGSRQCEARFDSQVTSRLIRSVKKELRRAGLKALEVRHEASDGKMRVQVCGAPTGAVIRIRIQEKDEEKAARLGFSKAD